MGSETVVEGFRLSLQQRRIWATQQENLCAAAQCVIAIDGALDRAALTAAVQSLIDRHEILRTTFHRLPGMTLPVQVVATSGAPAWQYSELCDQASQEQEASARAALAEERARPYDPAAGPVVRATLLALAPERHLLALTLPALNADSRTLVTLYEEVCGRYAAPTDGAADDVVQYVQYAEWQHETLASDGMHTTPAAGDASALALPFDRRSPTARRVADEPVRATLDPATAARLKQLSHTQGVDLRAIVLTCWQALLRRLTEQAELTIGMCFEARPFEELAGVCGPFAQQAPIDCRCTPQDTLLTLARRLETAIQAGEAILGQGGAVEDAALASSMEYVRYPEARRAGSALFALWALRPPADRARLRLVCLDEPDGLAIELYDQQQAFEQADRKRVATYLANLARAASAQPERAIATLPFLDEREQSEILVAFNTGAAYAAEPRCILDLFAEQVARAPDHPAVLCGAARLTYGELNGAANQLARHLRTLGVGPGTLVGLCLERSTDVAVGILGILKAGAAWVPLDPAYPGERLAFMVEDTGIRILLTQERLRERITLPRGRVVCLDGGWEQPGSAAAENLQTVVGPDDRAYVIYTSGSTGRPKGVAVTHGNLSHYVQALQPAFHLRPDDVYLHTASISFSSSVRQLMMPLVHGATLVIADYEQARDPLALFALMAARGVTVWDVVPTFWRHAAHTLAEARSAGAAASGAGGLRLVLSASEALTWDVPRLWLRVSGFAGEMINMYGQTETTGIIALYPIPRALAEREDEVGAVPVGRPLAGVQIYLLDAQLQPAPIGIPGDLYVGGGGVGQGYLHQPALTAERFIGDPFASAPGARLYATGDRARYRADGTIELLGRGDAQVKIRGYRVELGEIETVLRQHPAVRHAVVVARDEPSGERRLAAYCTLERPRACTAADLRAHIQAKVPDYMVPAAIVFLDAIPVNASGKVDRRALPAPESMQGESREVMTPRTETEALLVAICATVLGVEAVGVEDNFFDLGGHSLLATQLIARINEQLGAAIDLRALFAAPTMAGLARLVEETRATGGAVRAQAIVARPREARRA